MKLKKFWGVVLTLSLAVTTLIGCGNDDDDESTKSVDSFKSSIEAGSAISQYTSDTQLKLTIKGKEMLAEVDEEILDSLGVTNNKLDLALSMSTKYASEKANSAKVGYTVGKYSGDVLDVVSVDGTAYVNLRMLKDAIFDVVGDIEDIKDIKAEVEAAMPEGDYIELTPEILNELVDTSGFNMANIATTESTKEMTEFIEFIGKEFDKAAKKSEDDIYSKDGDCYTLKINNSNIDSIVSSLAEVASADADKIIEKFNAAFGDMGITAAQITQVSTLLQSFNLSENLGDDIKFEMSISSEVKDNTWNLGFIFNMSYGDEYIEMSVSHKKVEDKELKVEKPSSIIAKEDLEEMIESISNLEIEDPDVIDDDVNNGGSESTIDGIEIADDVKTTVTDAGTHGMSKDITVPQIYFDGKLYSIGKTTASEFLANGYTIDADYSDEYEADKKEEPYGTGEMYFLYFGEVSSLSVGIGNIGDKAKALKDSEVIYFDYDIYTDDDVELYLVGDITIGTSVEDVIKVLGNPTSVYDGTYLYSLTWSFDDGDYSVEYTLTFDSESDEMEAVTLERLKYSF